MCRLSSQFVCLLLSTFLFTFFAGIPVDQLVNNQQQDAGDLLAIALTSSDSEDEFRGQSLQSTDALQSLLATAAEGEDVIEEVQLIEETPVVRPERPRRPSGGARPGNGGRTRLPPGIPQRQRPRDNEKKGQRLPDQTRDRDNVDTVERYSHTNEDGSFTFGYIAEDGSFRYTYFNPFFKIYVYVCFDIFS